MMRGSPPAWARHLARGLGAAWRLEADHPWARRLAPAVFWAVLLAALARDALRPGAWGIPTEWDELWLQYRCLRDHGHPD